MTTVPYLHPSRVAGYTLLPILAGIGCCFCFPERRPAAFETGRLGLQVVGTQRAVSSFQDDRSSRDLCEGRLKTLCFCPTQRIWAESLPWKLCSCTRPTRGQRSQPRLGHDISPRPRSCSPPYSAMSSPENSHPTTWIQRCAGLFHRRTPRVEQGWRTT